ncbi:MAG TPA: ABC transporter permease [Bryobacteraceae bacterium]|nr:ABC transporter permease [Bryobacteraceae bacterium]
MEAFVKDLKHSIRMFAQSPGFTIAAVAALALGIGANTAIFSVVNTVLLKPLTYPDADRIVQFYLTSPQGSGPGASVPKFAMWHEQSDIFDDISAYDFSGPGLNLTGGAFPEQVKGLHVTATYFKLFGASAELGRTFTKEEDSPHGPHVIVLSDGLWRRRYGADPNIVGKSIAVGGDPYMVIGVVSRDFKFDPMPDLWLPFQFDLSTNDQAHYFVAAARLKPGITKAQAQARLKLVADQFRRRFPGTAALGPKDSFSVELLRDSIVSDVRSSLLVLVAAVALVLLIACANVANLLLVRATSRKREIAIRAAVGAGRGRIIRQLLTESVLLSVTGGVIGLALGMAGVRLLLAVSPGNIPRIGESGAAVTLDWRVLLFTLVVSVVTGVIFGLIPAFDASRADLSATLKESGGRSGSGFRQNKARSILVISEMTLAIVLLIGAALLIRTFVAIRSVNPGFNAHNVLTLQMSLTGPRFEKASGVGQLVRDGVERLQAIPGVEVAGSSCCIPLEGGFGLPLNIVGRPLTNGPNHGGAGWNSVGPGYFEVYKIPVLRGRTFNVRDTTISRPVVIINQALAKQFWPKSDPLRDQIVIGKGVGPEFEEGPRQIIGVVGDIHDGGLNRDARPNMYVPASQVTDGMTALNARIGPLVWLVRTKSDPHLLSNAIQKQLREASGGLPVAQVRTMDEIVVRSTAREDFNMLLLSIFAGSALLLAAIGIYALMSYSVQQRTQELGIRMALGAGASSVRNLVVMQGMRLALIGVVLGMAAAFGLTRYISSMLFQVKAWDPLVFITVPLILTAVSLVAIWLPAQRATVIDPVEALRVE